MKYFKRWKKDKKFRKNVIIGAIILILALNTINPDLGKKEAMTEQGCNSIFEDSTSAYCWKECWVGTPWSVVLGLTQCISCLFGKGQPSVEMFNECEDVGCYVQSSAGGDISIVDDVYTCYERWIESDVPFAEKCTLGVPNNRYVFNDKDSGCESGYGIESGKLCGNTVYKCKAPPSDDLVCKSWQKPFAKVLDGVWKKNDFDCPTKAYIVIGFVMFAAMAVI